MRKLFSLLLASLLIVGLASSALAVQPYASDSVEIYGKFRGPNGITPTSTIVKVRYAMQAADAQSLASGDVVVWDPTSSDGYTISACTTDRAISYAGVLVTTIQTTGVDATATEIIGYGDNIGYMCIQGYCLAKVDTSEAGTLEQLIANGSTLEAAFATGGADGIASQIETPISMDIGVLLQNTGADTSMPVWLR